MDTSEPEAKRTGMKEERYVSVEASILVELLEAHAEYYDLMDAAFIVTNSTMLSKAVERGTLTSLTEVEWNAWRKMGKNEKETTRR
jgi:hypothetical protein